MAYLYGIFPAVKFQHEGGILSFRFQKPDNIGIIVFAFLNQHDAHIGYVTGGPVIRTPHAGKAFLRDLLSAGMGAVGQIFVCAVRFFCNTVGFRTRQLFAVRLQDQMKGLGTDIRILDRKSVV